MAEWHGRIPTTTPTHSAFLIELLNPASVPSAFVSMLPRELELAVRRMISLRVPKETCPL